MNTCSLSVTAGIALLIGVASSAAAFHGDPPDETHPWTVHDMRRPQPPVVTPGNAPGVPPSDAVVLFDGASPDAWETIRRTDGGEMETVPATWRLVDGAMEVAPKTGSLQTKKQFGACQFHIEWRSPSTGHNPKWGAGEGNSGVFFIGLGAKKWGGAMYELQILDSYQNATYPDGQAAAVYGQSPPLVNASRPPGQWQVYDIVFHPPRFDAAGAVLDRGSITAFHNGVLVQDHHLFEGATGHGGRARLRPHAETGHILLQDYGIPIQFRNIWLRPLPPRHGPNPEEVAAIRQQTAEGIRAEAEKAQGRQRFLLFLESLIYADDQAARGEVNRYLANLASQILQTDPESIKKNPDELKSLHAALKYGVKNGILKEPPPAIAAIEQQLKAAGIQFK